MRNGRIVRSLAVLASATLVLGAFAAGPAEAKKKKKKKKPAACAPFTPSEQAAGAPIVKVTDAATAEAPVEVNLNTSPGLGFSSAEGEGNPDELGTTHAYANLQVDSASPETGLYVVLEFGAAWDYDLWLRDGSHTALEYSAGIGPVGSGTDHQHSNVGSESIEGMPVTDCQGIVVDVANAGGPGGEVTLKFYLGDAI